jgi:hypothetical protein
MNNIMSRSWLNRNFELNNFKILQSHSCCGGKSTDWEGLPTWV